MYTKRISEQESGLVTMKPVKPLNITYLISSWLSISIIFLIGEVVIRFGVFSSLVIVGAFILAFGVSFLLQKLMLSWAFRLEKSPILGKIISALRLLEIYVLHLYICGLIFETFFQMKVHISVISTTIIVMVLIMYLPRGEKLQLNIKDAKFIIISGLAIVLPTYIYLQKGLESLYHNLLYYQPQLLNHDSINLWLLFWAAFFIFFSKLLFRGEGLKYISTSVKKGISKLLMAVFIFCTFIMAFATMNIVAITQNLDVSHANELFILMIKKLSPSVAFNIFCFFLYFGTLVILIDALPSNITETKNNKVINVTFILILISALITMVVFDHFTLLFVYVFFGFLISILVTAATIIRIFHKCITRKSI